MTADELLELHTELCDRARSLLAAKSHDYAGGRDDRLVNLMASETLGVPAEIAILCRVMDKFQRVVTFVQTGTLKVEDEKALDSILDVINYMVLLQAVISRKSISEKQLATLRETNGSLEKLIHSK